MIIAMLRWPRWGRYTENLSTGKEASDLSYRGSGKSKNGGGGGGSGDNLTMFNQAKINCHQNYFSRTVCACYPTPPASQSVTLSLVLSFKWWWQRRRWWWWWTNSLLESHFYCIFLSPNFWFVIWNQLSIKIDKSRTVSRRIVTIISFLRLDTPLVSDLRE